ncbi:MAG TPA: hypothetical protein VFR86_16655 [Burkholderiaceae bacterium]|nr:hypothetical protein [Burkholderiaceae bacterium]
MKKVSILLPAMMFALVAVQGAYAQAQAPAKPKAQAQQSAGTGEAWCPEQPAVPSEKTRAQARKEGAAAVRAGAPPESDCPPGTSVKSRAEVRTETKEAVKAGKVSRSGEAERK